MEWFSFSVRTGIIPTLSRFPVILWDAAGNHDFLKGFYYNVHVDVSTAGPAQRFYELCHKRAYLFLHYCLRYSIHYVYMINPINFNFIYFIYYYVYKKGIDAII